MQRRTSLLAATLLGLTAMLTFLPAGTASAHVVKTVGNLRVTVGFGDEPVYTGFENSGQVILATKGGKPITDLGESLKIEIIYGTQKMQLPLEPTFDPDTGLGTPGDYRAWFFPTAPGKYTFHLFGSVHGQKVNLSCASSPTTFDEAIDPSTVEFPTKVPSNGQIAERLTRELPRLDRVERAVPAAQSTASSAHDTAGTAQILAIVGIVVGAGGAAFGLLGLRAARAARRAQAG